MKCLEVFPLNDWFRDAHHPGPAVGMDPPVSLHVPGCHLPG